MPVAMLLFSVVSLLLLYLIQRLQGYLPFNPQNLPGVDSQQRNRWFCWVGLQYCGFIHQQYKLAELCA